MHASGTLLRTEYDPADSPWADAARAAIESGDAAAPFRVGDHDAAARALGDLSICLSGSSFESHHVHCLEQLALVEACRGRLTRAQELADAAEHLAVETAVPTKQRRAAGHLARAWVATERQELSRALHWLDRATRLDELGNDPLLAALAVLLRARLMRDRGNPSAARELLTTRRVTAAWVREELEAEAADLAPEGRGRPGTAADRFDPLLDPGDVPVQTESSQVQRLLQRAERETARGRGDTARTLTLGALELAEPELLRRPFRHAGPHVRRLIRADPEIAARADWLSTAGHLEAGPVAERTTGPLPDELTQREHEVLRNLAALLTTQEIAAAMFISVNTVRTHVRHILEKLAATRRNEAVRRARQLGLV
jgi:LuxR family transcriptional regulator, maltose regulon positive regulatory protein